MCVWAPVVWSSVLAWPTWPPTPSASPSWWWVNLTCFNTFGRADLRWRSVSQSNTTELCGFCVCTRKKATSFSDRVVLLDQSSWVGEESLKWKQKKEFRLNQYWPKREGTAQVFVLFLHKAWLLFCSFFPRVNMKWIERLFEILVRSNKRSNWYNFKLIFFQFWIDFLIFLLLLCFFECRVYPFWPWSCCRANCTPWTGKSTTCSMLHKNGSVPRRSIEICFNISSWILRCHRLHHQLLPLPPLNTPTTTSIQCLLHHSTDRNDSIVRPTCSSRQPIKATLVHRHSLQDRWMRWFHTRPTPSWNHWVQSRTSWPIKRVATWQQPPPRPWWCTTTINMPWTRGCRTHSIWWRIFARTSILWSVSLIGETSRLITNISGNAMVQFSGGGEWLQIYSTSDTGNFVCKSPWHWFACSAAWLAEIDMSIQFEWMDGWMDKWLELACHSCNSLRVGWCRCRCFAMLKVHHRIPNPITTKKAIVTGSLWWWFRFAPTGK